MTYVGVGPPLIPKGAKIGLHSLRPNRVIPLVRAAKARGTYWALVKGVDNGGVAIDVKAIEPRTLTITRFVNAAEDSCQGVETWSDAQMHSHAAAALDFVWNRLNSKEKDAADWIEPINEAAPHGPAAYTAYGTYLCVMLDEAKRRGMKLALPAFNAGTPEWDETHAMLRTGVGQLIKDGGHIWTGHEGVFGDVPVQYGFGDLIPGAPPVAGAGSLCLRSVYLMAQLAARGEVAPFVASEWYGGGGFKQSPAHQLARFQWYDGLTRQYAWFLAFTPFTIDPVSQWVGSDYTYAYDAVLDYLIGQKDTVNNTVYPGQAPSYPPGTTHVVTNCSMVNVRQWPYTGDPPPVVYQLAAGAAVHVYGLYKTASLVNGWCSVSPHSREWIRADFLQAVTA